MSQAHTILTKLLTLRTCPALTCLPSTCRSGLGTFPEGRSRGWGEGGNHDTGRGRGPQAQGEGRQIHSSCKRHAGPHDPRC